MSWTGTWRNQSGSTLVVQNDAFAKPTPKGDVICAFTGVLREGNTFERV
jgi:hypothetical protein